MTKKPPLLWSLDFLQVKNSVMTFEPFHCTFVDDTFGFSVKPTEGTLNRRSGEPTMLEVSFKGKVGYFSPDRMVSCNVGIARISYGYLFANFILWSEHEAIDARDARLHMKAQ